MPIGLQEHFPLCNFKISSNSFRLHYNVLVLIEVKELQEDVICYNPIPPNSSEIPEDSNGYDANQDSYISRNPEPLIKYAAASSSMQHKRF